MNRPEAADAGTRGARVWGDSECGLAVTAVSDDEARGCDAARDAARMGAAVGGHRMRLCPRGSCARSSENAVRWVSRSRFPGWRRWQTRRSVSSGCTRGPIATDAAGISRHWPGSKESSASCQRASPSLAGFPASSYAGGAYHFSFVRLSLVQQSVDPAFHLDSDADTALTGDVTGLAEREDLRLLINLSTRSDRALHYLDVDPWSVPLEVQGSYVRAANPTDLDRHACTAMVPRRRGSTVHGVAFTSNCVLHSGVDDADGHFVAAYGTEASVAMRSASRPPAPSKAASTRSRILRCSASPTAFAPNTH